MTDQANTTELTTEQKAVQLLVNVSNLPELKLDRQSHKQIEAAIIVFSDTAKEKLRLQAEVFELRESLSDSKERFDDLEGANVS